MEAEKKVSAETYRERDLPPGVPLSGIVASLSLVLAVFSGLCGAAPVFNQQTAAWFVMAMAALAVIGLSALLVCLVKGARFYGWRLGLFDVPPKHTIKAQFLRLLSDLGYLPMDTTKWHTRDFRVEVQGSHVFIHVRGGVKKGLDELEDDLRSKGYMVGAQDVEIQPENDINWNAGFKVVLDYMPPDVRARKYDELDRGRW